MDYWLSECGFEIDAPGELATWSSRSILMVACMRAREPETKHDTIPVLVGPQGCGKSALAWLMPPEYRNEWFTDGDLPAFFGPVFRVSLRGLIQRCQDLLGWRRFRGRRYFCVLRDPVGLARCFRHRHPAAAERLPPTSSPHSV